MNPSPSCLRRITNGCEAKSAPILCRASAAALLGSLEAIPRAEAIGSRAHAVATSRPP